MKSIRSNRALRRQNKVLGMHPTTWLAILAIAGATMAIFSIFELNPYLGWGVFITLSASVFVMAPNGLGDVAARIIPPPQITRGCNLYESPFTSQKSKVKSQKSRSREFYRKRR